MDHGELITGETVRIAYYQQQTEPIPDDKRMINYLNEVGQSVVNKDGERISTTQLLEQFLFPRFMHGTLIRKIIWWRKNAGLLFIETFNAATKCFTIGRTHE